MRFSLKALGIVLVVLSFLPFSAAGIALATQPEIVTVPMCHATGSESNPYTNPTVSVHSVDDANGLNGHGVHSGDIWASFVYGGVTYPGQGNQSILANGCEVDNSTPEPTQEPTETQPPCEGNECVTETPPPPTEQPCWNPNIPADSPRCKKPKDPPACQVIVCAYDPNTGVEIPLLVEGDVVDGVCQVPEGQRPALNNPERDENGNIVTDHWYCAPPPPPPDEPPAGSADSGMALPLLGLGFLMLAVGAVLYRLPKRVEISNLS